MFMYAREQEGRFVNQNAKSAYGQNSKKRSRPRKYLVNLCHKASR